MSSGTSLPTKTILKTNQTMAFSNLIIILKHWQHNQYDIMDKGLMLIKLEGTKINKSNKATTRAGQESVDHVNRAAST